MLLYRYMPDCCDQCCDCEKADPQKDRVCIGKVFEKDAQVAPTTPEDKVFTKEPVFGRDPVKLTAAMEIAAKSIVHNAQEIREMQTAQDIADAAAAQEAVEAQELSEAFKASLHEYEKMAQRARDIEDAERYQLELRQRRKEEQEEQQKIEAFLKKNKFDDVNFYKKTFFKAFYPLHCAVSQNDSEMVQLLLATGARPLTKNSSGLTPLALAQKLDKKGSHAQILKLLRFGAES